jgi:hypothetical protein
MSLEATHPVAPPPALPPPAAAPPPFDVGALGTWFKESKASISAFLSESTPKTPEEKLQAEYVALFKEEGLKRIPLKERGEKEYRARRHAWLRFAVVTEGKKFQYEPKQDDGESRLVYLRRLTEWYNAKSTQILELRAKQQQQQQQRQKKC